MASGEKDDFDKYKTMYQDEQKAVAKNSSNCSTKSSDAPPEQGHSNATGIQIPCSARIPTLAPVSAPVRTIIDKRTYEQVYKEDLKKRHKLVYVTPEKKKPVESQHVPEQSNMERQGQYTTTIYNITSHDVSNGTFNMLAKAPQPIPTVMSVSKPSIVIPKPTMEVISYQKSLPNAYAKRLIEITKSGMKKLEIPSTTATNSLLIRTYKHPTDIPPQTSTVPQTSKYVQNLPHCNVNGATEGKQQQRYTVDAEQQEEKIRRLQAQEELRKAAIPTLETFAQNGEAVRISNHQSNILVSLLNPTVSSPPAPAHVYGTPRVGTGEVQNSTERFHVPDYAGSSNVTIQNQLGNVPGGLAEPPPAHMKPTDNPIVVACAKSSSTAITLPQSSSRSEVQHCSQDQVLNLDTKHSVSQSDRGTESFSIPIPVCRSSTVEQTNNLITQAEAVAAVNTSAGLVSNASTLPVEPNPGMAITLPTSQALWNHLQNYNLQQLLAHVQAVQQQTQQMATSSTQMSIMDHLKLNMLFRSADNIQAPFVFERQTGEFKAKQPTKAKTPTKRKNTFEGGDSSTKRKLGRPKLSRAAEPFLQNEPCYKVSSRLPRCRECGRSAATRSRHALNIFCRFFAFRKLKYNEIGKLEVAGFADPYLDPKATDISLWSSNLKRVPVDLTIEKSKFLLGQVGYKFCELFHQEKEAHFEHLSTDKTIAWKQAVQGVREMCDVCQTTLFNHHWVCRTCGFVVCIDCYKCRKNGVITAESTTKDKDTHGWLLCSNAKEPHSQDQLMLTQIIPSNCLYKLVRQMHGICALLEIPLNCECPLSKEPLFRKIKDKLEFIYPITMTGGAEEEVFYDFSGPISAPSVQITRMVSITIKSIRQEMHLDGGVGPEGGDEPIACTIEFNKQFHEDERQSSRSGEDLSRGTPTNETVNNEKQSYSFEGFQNEIRADGDHFDESLYKIPTTDKTDAQNLTPEEGGETQTEDASAEITKIEMSTSNQNGCEVSLDYGPDLITSIPCAGATRAAALIMEAGTEEEPMYRIDDVSGKGAMMSNEPAGADDNLTIYDTQMDASDKHPQTIQVLEVTPTNEIMKTECVHDNQNGTQHAANHANGLNTPIVSKTKSPSCKKQASKEPAVPTVAYNEDGRYKPSPPMDPTTFAMIVKQMVKFDKTVDIFSTFQRHMTCDAVDQLDDFVESISVKPERVRQFLVDFLNDFVFLRGQNSSDDLTNERQIMDYNRYIKAGLKFRNKGERKMHINESSALYPAVAHQWLCNGKLLRLLDPLDVRNYQLFHDQWERGQPVMVSAVSSKMNMDLWIPKSFGRDFGEQVNDLVNCFNGKVVRGHPMKVFWEGFEQIGERLQDERDRPMMLKLKDWPPGDDFAEMMPTRFYDLMKSLPLAEYTRREGRLNLASRLSSFFVRPDLGPKMYSAYGSALHPNKGTTNLHLDISDAVNVMVYVGVPTDVPQARYSEKILEVIDMEDCDYLTRQRIRERKELPGALWHIYHAQDADRIRELLNKIELERGGTIKANHDPIHDQKWYLDRNMRRRLQQEYGVEGYAIVQCSGDAIFIPAGAPHQVRNLHNCIKVAEDFVSPENISYCFKLTNEFRHLSKTHSNHEDKLQIKNIIYHAVKDAVSSITNPLIMMAGQGSDP
uniref:[histone H3]-dimethyl-L-lysine(9) demethylase n=1 Tax=Anopheles atroparvus TaxID=41427 RepID=A0AAG5CZ14_ANOAO